jgi:hypothetical protein
VDRLPRPWHFEFWLTIPDDLPFSLCHIDDDDDNNNNSNGYNNNNNNNIEIVFNDQVKFSPTF